MKNRLLCGGFPRIGWIAIVLTVAFLFEGLKHPLFSSEADSTLPEIKQLTVAQKTVTRGAKRRRKKKVKITVAMLDDLVKSKQALPGRLAALPEVPIPPDNPQTEMKIALGKILYFDPRLSSDGDMACSTCHSPGLGFADGMDRSMGFREELGRHSPTVLNAAYNKVQFWDGRSPSLEDQAKGPILAAGEMNNTEENVIAFLNSIPAYKKLFKTVFGRNPDYDDVGKAIASFERTIVTPNAPFDRYMNGEMNALSPKEKRGLILFVSKASCSQCHKGPNFTDDAFHNLAVPQVGPLKEDLGRFNVTKDDKDRGAFKTPTVRNITLTGPYMHNGVFTTLKEVVDFYDQGGGVDPNKDPKVKPLNLTDGEKEELIAFMKTLTGDQPRVEFPLLPQ